MIWAELPERWKDKIDRYLSESGNGYSQLSIADFQNDLRLIFEDGSKADFRSAFFILDEENHEVGVFTEHCGYHIFPYSLERVETVDRNGNILMTEAATIS